MPYGKIEVFDVGSHNWDAYCRRIKQFIALNNIEEELHVATLVTLVGEACYELMCDLCAPDHPEDKTFAELESVVKQHLEPQRSEIAERHVFRQRKQQAGETIGDYLQHLKHLAKTCNFSDTLEINLRDQFVSGLRCEDMRSRLFAERDIDYKRAVELALSLEAADRHAATAAASGAACAIEGLHRFGPTGRGHRGGGGARSATAAGSPRKPCTRCGKEGHLPVKCRFKNYNCDQCGERGHLKAVCTTADGRVGNSVRNNKVVSHTILLFSLCTSVTPGWYRRNGTDWTLSRPCSLIEHTTSATCHRTERQLRCRGGISNQWMKGIQHDIIFLSVQEWPGDCLNIGRLQQHFPALQELHLINCTSLQSFKGHFDGESKITKIVMHGLTSLWEIPPEVLAQMQDLRELDLRNNVLRHMKARLLKGPPLLERVYLSDNKWDCSDGGLDWLAMERDDGTVKRRIVDYYQLICHQQLYRGKPLHKVMNIIRTVRHTCPEPCSCAMTHVVSDTQGALIPLITADCAARSLEEPPETLPPSTTTVRLEGNKIDSIRMMIQNPHYMKLADLHLDNNSISTVKELEGSEWFNSFRVLSLRGNMLKQIPVYAFDKAFQSNNNIVHVFLGHNPWRCDCHFIPRFQALLLKYKRVIRDLPDIRCSQSQDKTISLAQISTMPLGNVCRSGVEMPISPINIVNLTLATLLFVVIGRFLYDWHSFKNTGKLPWISSILP